MPQRQGAVGTVGTAHGTEHGTPQRDLTIPAQRLGSWVNRLMSATHRLATGDGRCRQYAGEFDAIIAEMAEAATTTGQQLGDTGGPMRRETTPPDTPLEGRVT